MRSIVLTSSSGAALDPLNGIGLVFKNHGFEIGYPRQFNHYFPGPDKAELEIITGYMGAFSCFYNIYSLFDLVADG
jgi:hypothetical protein